MNGIKRVLTVKRPTILADLISKRQLSPISLRSFNILNAKTIGSQIRQTSSVLSLPERKCDVINAKLISIAGNDSNMWGVGFIAFILAANTFILGIEMNANSKGKINIIGIIETNYSRNITPRFNELGH